MSATVRDSTHVLDGLLYHESDLRIEEHFTDTGVGVQGKLLATEQGLLSIVKALSASNLLNRNDALNLSSQLAAEQVRQLQKLRELPSGDMTGKAADQHRRLAIQVETMCKAVRSKATAKWAHSTEVPVCKASAQLASCRFTPDKGDGKAFKAGWK